MKNTCKLFATLLIAATMILTVGCRTQNQESAEVLDTMNAAQLNIATIGVINFDSIAEDVQTGFKGGEGDVAFRIFKDDLNKVMRVRMTPLSSVGQHSHETDSEIILVLKGNGKVIFDGQELPIHEGQVHYCPKGHAHTIINDTDEELHLCCVVPQQ